MKKMRERRLGDDVILEVLRINKAYPDMKAGDIATMIKGKGLAECVSASWVSDVILCGSLGIGLSNRRSLWRAIRGWR